MMPAIRTAFATLALALPALTWAEGRLSLYNWGDYINPEILERFGKEHGVKVTLDTYGSNEEMLAKIQAGATGYDIVFPSVHMHDIMAKLGLQNRLELLRAADRLLLDELALQG